MPKAELQKSIYKNLFTRTFGGTTEPGVADLFISGYGYFWFEYLPPDLPKYVPGMTLSEIQMTLAALCQRVTPPGETINKTTQPGLGGKKWSTPTNLEVGDTATISFFEISGTPLKKIMSGWTRLIRDMRHGASGLKGSDYTKVNYSATGYKILTKPDGMTIETVEYYTGLWPTKNPLDNFNLDIATNDKVDVDIDFSVDNIYDDFEDKQAWIVSKSEKIIQAITQARESFENFKI